MHPLIATRRARRTLNQYPAQWLDMPNILKLSPGHELAILTTEREAENLRARWARFRRAIINESKVDVYWRRRQDLFSEIKLKITTDGDGNSILHFKLIPHSDVITRSIRNIPMAVITKELKKSGILPIDGHESLMISTFGPPLAESELPVLPEEPDNFLELLKND